MDNEGEEHMTFDEWWEEFDSSCPLDITDSEIAKRSWEAGIQEGIHRMYMMHDFCPECKVAYDRHKMDCSRG